MKEKSRKLFEKVDDNPGSYFGMLVEGLEDKEESLNEDYITDLVAEILGKKFPMDKRNIKWLSNNGTSGEVEYKGQKFAFRKLPNGDYKVMRSSDAGWNWSETLFKDESLKEDKFVSRDKMSKKDRKELDSQKRNTWGNTNPVTRVQPNKKAYDRKRDKKANLDESVRDFEWDRKLWCVVNDDGSFAGVPCLAWEEARELSINHDGSRIYEMTLDKDQVHNDEEDLSAYGMEYGYYN